MWNYLSNTSERSAKFELDTTDWRKTLRDLIFFITACALWTLWMIVNATANWETFDPQIAWTYFYTAVAAWVIAWLNRYFTDYKWT